MKKFFLVILFLPFLMRANAQSVRETRQWRQLLQTLQDENWKDADSLSFFLLNKSAKNEQEEPAIATLRYMYIYSEAGLMSLRKRTQAQALKNVAGFTGKYIALPAHPIVLGKGSNSIQMVSEKTDSLFVVSTNKAATAIFSFEYIILGDKWPVDDFKNSAGKMFRLGGKIQSIQVEGNMFPRFRIIIEEGVYAPYRQYK